MLGFLVINFCCVVVGRQKTALGLLKKNFFFFFGCEECVCACSEKIKGTKSTEQLALKKVSLVPHCNTLVTLEKRLNSSPIAQGSK